ncbi:MAG: hypothetical protein ACR2HW_06675 [Gemmatimonadales bacterium]
MRNYWVRIALGAAAIFIVGMVGLTLVRRGLGTVHGVVHGSGPISIPLAFIPFTLNGDKLGTLQRLTMKREKPDSVTSVELQVKLSDSLLARGLEGCRLAANLDSDKSDTKGVSVSVNRGQFVHGTFWCATNDSTSSDLVEYGQAVFHPGNVTVPLFLSQDMVDELQNLDFDDDSTNVVDEAQVDSIVAAAKLIADSVKAAVAVKAVEHRTIDSLRAEGQRRGDSASRVTGHVAPPKPPAPPAAPR